MVAVMILHASTPMHRTLLRITLENNGGIGILSLLPLLFSEHFFHFIVFFFSFTARVFPMLIVQTTKARRLRLQLSYTKLTIIAIHRHRRLLVLLSKRLLLIIRQEKVW